MLLRMKTSHNRYSLQMVPSNRSDRSRRYSSSVFQGTSCARESKATPQCTQPPLPAAQGQSLTYILAPPDFDGPVLGGGVEQAITPPLHTGHRLRVACEDFVTPAHQRVPDADAAVLGGTGQVTALWVSGQKDQIHLCSSPEPQRIAIKCNFLLA